MFISRLSLFGIRVALSLNVDNKPKHEVLAGKWTPELVREHLPEVTIEHGGQKTEYRIAGRLLPFAGVCGTGWTFAWGTIARALNTGASLKVS